MRSFAKTTIFEHAQISGPDAIPQIDVQVTKKGLRKRLFLLT